MSDFENVFAIDTSNIKYGSGVTNEVGFEMNRLGSKRVMLVTDPKIAKSNCVEIAIKSLNQFGIETILFDHVSVEPTDDSFKLAIKFAQSENFDGYVAIGGGSSIDTAKAANLYATYPADFFTYVNSPIGDGVPVPGVLKPLIAIPTTAGTGSETTGVAIFDLLDIKAKTGISHRYLRPNMGMVDPDNVKTLPQMVVSCSGLDVLCHGLESFTAIPFSRRPATDSPSVRSPYQGANPISDIWALKAIEMVSNNIVKAYEDPDNISAKGEMLLAATFAGFGFGNAGVHLPHGMSYPVAGRVKEFLPKDYPIGHSMVPHGMSVILNAPAVFRFTAPSNPKRHLHAAKLLGADIDGANLEDAGDILADSIISLIKKIGIPNGLNGVGYSSNDIDDLVDGTMPQQRVISLSPRPVNKEDIRNLFTDSMKLW
ncbi:MAG: hydroxyacid-oxoacid transhydrogenase [Dehalococcoidia bacterium]